MTREVNHPPFIMSFSDERRTETSGGPISMPTIRFRNNYYVVWFDSEDHYNALIEFYESEGEDADSAGYVTETILDRLDGPAKERLRDFRELGVLAVVHFWHEPHQKLNHRIAFSRLALNLIPYRNDRKKLLREAIKFAKKLFPRAFSKGIK